MSFCNQFSKIDLPLLGLVRVPAVSIDQETRNLYGVTSTASNRDFWKRVVWSGYKDRRRAGTIYEDEAAIIDRLRMEFDVFEKTGTIDYLLIVWDMIRWCDTNGIPRGPGRGSVTGSLSCFCAGITAVNPLKHSLNFTRFISEARARPKIIDGILYANGKSLCDIDCDISFSQRDRVLAYLQQKYPGRTAKISNRLELTGKTAFKDVIKAYLNYDEQGALGVSSYIEALFGKVESLNEAIEREPLLKEWTNKIPENAEAVRIANQISGLTIAKGVHASGVFISYAPLDGAMATEYSKNGELVTVNEMDVVAEQGVKLDCLALKTVDVIDETCKMVGLKVEDIDVNHPSIYSYLSSTDLYYGCFQIESGVTQEVVSRLGPRHLDDLASCLAIGRPGSLKFKDDLIAYVKTGKLKSIYPPLDELLVPTGGIIIYQETINDVCQQLYKMSAVDADEVRRAISKKVREDMAKWEPVLYEKGKEQGIPRDVTAHFWKTCNASADYLFSKNHCYAYTYITAQTVYLKANHLLHFMLSQLRMAKHEQDTIACLMAIMGECRKMGIAVLPPDLFKSGIDFNIEGNAIRFGLGHIRGISDTTMAKLNIFRQKTFNTKFEVFDAAHAAGIDIRVLGSLIASGCLSWKDTSRAKLALDAQTYNLLSDNQQLKVKQFAAEYNEDIIEILKALPSKTTATGKPVMPPAQLDRIRRDYEPYHRMYLANVQNERFSAYVLERTFLGYSYSTTLHEVFSERVQGLLTLDQVSKLSEKKRLAAEAARAAGSKIKGESEEFRFVGFIEWTKQAVSRAGDVYFKAIIKDDSGSVTVQLHGEERLDGCRSYNGRLPAEDDIVIVTGSLSRDGNLVFASSISIQPNPVLTKKPA